jgi:hypothetical protein
LEVDLTLPKRIFAAGFLVIFGFVLVEIILHVVGVSFPIFDTYDNDRVLKLMPGKKGRYDKEGSGYLSINSLGYRDDEHTLKKPPGVFRIAVLGDSFTEARQVELNETYWKRLESILNNDLGRHSNDRVEVLNFGIGGYGQSEELLTLKLDVLAFSPDLILVGFFSGNDLVNNLKSLSTSIRGESIRPFFVLVDGELVLDDSFRDPGLSYYLRRFLLTATHYSRTLQVVNQIRRLVVVRQLQAERKENKPEVTEDDQQIQQAANELGVKSGQYALTPDAEWEAAWSITQALLGEMQRQSAAIGASFVVATISEPPQVHPKPSVRERYANELGVPDLFYPERRLAQIAQSEGFHLIAMVEQMQKEATLRNTYLHGFENTAWGEGHWNKEAHFLAAEIIAADMLSRGLISN